MPQNAQNDAAGSRPGMVAALFKVEDTLLVLLLFVMIVLSVLQIVLRNLFGSGIFWGDALVRLLVLWIGLAGAMVASRRGDHICIDLVSRYLPPRLRFITGVVVGLFTALVCAVVTWHSMTLLRFEFEDGTRAFAMVPVWVCELIIPVAFAVIGVRYLLYALLNLKKAMGPLP